MEDGLKKIWKTTVKKGRRPTKNGRQPNKFDFFKMEDDLKNKKKWKLT
jgi:hypothetical protein